MILRNTIASSDFVVFETGPVSCNRLTLGFRPDGKAMRGLKTLVVAAPLAFALAATGPSQAAERTDFTGIWMSDKGDGATELRACGEGLCGYIYSILVVPDPSMPLRDNRNTKPELRNRALCGLQVL